MIARSWLSIFTLNFFCVFSSAWGAIPSSAAVAQVGEHVVTLRELQIFSAFQDLLSSSAARPESKSFTLASELKEIETLAGEWAKAWMVHYEAENFGVAQVKADELSAAYDRVQTAFATWEDWRKLQVSRGELMEFLNVWIRSQRFLDFKKESTAVSVSDAEVREYYDQNRLKFGNLPFSRFEQNIRRYLSGERLGQRMAEWFQVLERKHRLRYFSLSE